MCIETVNVISDSTVLNRVMQIEILGECLLISSLPDKASITFVRSRAFETDSLFIIYSFV